MRGIDAYRETWPPFFAWQRTGASSRSSSLEVTAGDDVAFAYALLRCGTPEELARTPRAACGSPSGCARSDDRWVVAHEHHSFVHRD